MLDGKRVTPKAFGSATHLELVFTPSAPITFREAKLCLNAVLVDVGTDVATGKVEVIGVGVEECGVQPTSRVRGNILELNKALLDVVKAGCKEGLGAVKRGEGYIKSLPEIAPGKVLPNTSNFRFLNGFKSDNKGCVRYCDKVFITTSIV